VVTFLVLNIRLRAFSLRPCGKRCLCFLYLTCRHWMISSKTNVRFISTVSPHGSSSLRRPRSFNPRASPSTRTLPFQCPLTTTAPSIPIHCHLFPRYTTLWSVLTFHSPLLFSVRPQRYITDDAALECTFTSSRRTGRTPTSSRRSSRTHTSSRKPGRTHTGSRKPGRTHTGCRTPGRTHEHPDCG